MPKINLTQLVVDRIKPPVGKPREEHFDKNQPGFALRVTDRGGKSWVVFYRRRGESKIERYTIGSLEDFPKVEQARDIARQIRQQAAKGENPKVDQQAERAAKAAAAALTVDVLIEEYLTRWARPKKRSADEDERVLKRELLGKSVKGEDVDGVESTATWRGRPIAEITRRDIVLLLDRVIDRGSPIMANRTLAVVRRMFNFAIERGLLDTSPCVKVKPPGQETARERNLTDAEIGQAWSGLDRSPMEENIRRLLRFILTTAQRKGEAIGLHEREIDREAKIWTIPAARAKNGREHVVPLSPLALEIIGEKRKGRDEDDGWIFPSRKTGRPYQERSIDHAVRDLFMHRPPPRGRKPTDKPKASLVLAGAELFTPHDLRRTAATKMREIGIGKDDVKMVLNHKDRSVTGVHYDRYEGLREKRHALDSWARKLEALIRPGTENVVEIPRIA